MGTGANEYWDKWALTLTAIGKMGTRGGSRGDVGGASSPPAIFKHDFDECNFSIISNLFDKNKPYVLSTQGKWGCFGHGYSLD